METSDLGPLGGVYEDRLWPLNDDDIAQVEATTRWHLPQDYKRFVAVWGASAPVDGIWCIDCGSEEPATPFDMFFGASPSSSSSVVQNAGAWLEPLKLLAVARADNGLFFLAPDGHVLFERSRSGKLHRVADSFAGFLADISRVPGHEGPE